MDAQRFDNLARTLASRFSRRKALRQAGAGAAASLLAATGLRPEQADALVQAQRDGQPLYTIIRRYTLDVPSGQVRRALQQGYVDDACKAPGFVAYLTVEDEDGDFATIAVFRSQNDLQSFANAEANWIAQNLGDLLPAPDEAISGDTYIHAAVPDGFPNTCPAPAPPPAPTVVPAPTGPAPTGAPVTPTAVPPAPTPAPPCTSQGCVCATGTRAPCDDGLVCCPTTDLLGGPGVCQPEDVCYPNDCRANGRNCPRSCGTAEACPNCCANYCNADGLCDDPPAPCTGEGCACVTGTQNPCDDGLVCCGTTNTPGGPGVCQTEAECDPPCTSQGCDCNGGVQNACDAGLICCQEGQSIPGGAGTCQPAAECPGACTSEGCACITGTQALCDDGFVCCGTTGVPGGPGTCMTEAECDPPCTAQGCACNGGVLGACDTGLVCCQDGVAIPGGAGTCQPESQCPPPPCTGEGCDCIGGTEGACDTGLICCVQGDVGAPGTCQTEANCPGSLCVSEGCPCNAGVQNACADGLVCCQEGQSIPGGPGTCQPPDACGPPPCRENGAACDGICNWDDSCGSCCSGYCNSTGTCDDQAQATCIADGQNCGPTCNWSDGCDACCSGFCDGAGNCNEPGASAGACGDQGCGCELANPACVEGLVCCDDGSGVTGTCMTGC